MTEYFYLSWRDIYFEKLSDRNRIDEICQLLSLLKIYNSKFFFVYLNRLTSLYVHTNRAMSYVFVHRNKDVDRFCEIVLFDKIFTNGVIGFAHNVYVSK